MPSTDPRLPSTSDAQHILLVDDNPSVTHALSRILATAGFHVQSYHHGLNALAYAQADTTSIDAVVVDIHLPDISGLALSHSLREHLGPKVPIIVVSGDTSMENLNALPAIGASYFFSKPLQPSQLIACLKKWLE